VERWGIAKPLVGVVHLQPLPGSPGYGKSMAKVLARALQDASAYLEEGMHALLIENFGDRPFYPGRAPAETIASMAAIAREVRRLGRFPLGVNVLRSDGRGALAVATAAEAQFVRVNVLAGAMATDQGLIQGCAAETLRLRARLGAATSIWADVLVKHAQPLVPVDPVTVALDLKERAMADALILTGPRTGLPVDPDELARLRAAVRGIPWIAGSGVRASGLKAVWRAADGFIVGSSLEKGGRAGGAVDRGRVRELTAEHRRLSSEMSSGATDVG